MNPSVSWMEPSYSEGATTVGGAASDQETAPPPLETGLAPVDLQCPICVERIQDAFVTPCGHTFCYRCISTHLGHKRNCPSCGKYLTTEHIHPNFLLNKILAKAVVPSAGLQPRALTDCVQQALQLRSRGRGGSALSVLRGPARVKELDAAIALLLAHRQGVIATEAASSLHLLLCLLRDARQRQVDALTQAKSHLSMVEQDLSAISSWAGAAKMGQRNGQSRAQTAQQQQGANHTRMAGIDVQQHSQLPEANGMSSMSVMFTSAVNGMGSAQMQAGLRAAAAAAIAQGGSLHVHTLSHDQLSSISIGADRVADVAESSAVMDMVVRGLALSQQQQQNGSSSAAQAAADQAMMPSEAEDAAGASAHPSTAAAQQQQQQHADVIKPMQVEIKEEPVEQQPLHQHNYQNHLQQQQPQQQAQQAPQLPNGAAAHTSWPPSTSSAGHDRQHQPPASTAAHSAHPKVPQPELANGTMSHGQEATASPPPPAAAAAAAAYRTPTPPPALQQTQAQLQAAAAPAAAAHSAAGAAANGSTPQAPPSRKRSSAAAQGSGGTGDTPAPAAPTPNGLSHTAHPAGSAAAVVPAALNLGALRAAKKRRILAQFDQLQHCYLSMHSSAAVADGQGHQMQTADPAGSAKGSSTRQRQLLQRFSKVLSSSTAYSHLTVLAEVPRASQGGPALAGPSAAASHSQRSSSHSMVACIDLDCEERLFATCSARHLHVWDYASVVAAGAVTGNAREPASSASAAPRPHAGLVSRNKLVGVAFSKHQQQLLAVCDTEGSVCLYDATTMQLTSELLEAHDSRVWALDWTPATVGDSGLASGSEMGHMLASGSDDYTVKLWGPQDSSPRMTIDTRANVCSVRFNPWDPRYLAVGSAAHAVTVYDLRRAGGTAPPVATLTGHHKAVSYVRWANREGIVSASTDSTLRLWDVRGVLGAAGGDGSNSYSDPFGMMMMTPGASAGAAASGCACVRSFAGHVNERNFVGLSLCGEWLAAGSETNEVVVYHAAMPTPCIRHALPNGSNQPARGRTSSRAAAGGGGEGGGRSGNGNGSGAGGGSSSSPSPFISSLVWRQASRSLLVANSQGTLWVLGMQPSQ